MFIRDQRFPISTGVIVAAFQAGLAAYSSGLTVAGKVPATPTRRMVTVRDDGGNTSGRVQSRRQGVNVWADSAVDAATIAFECIHVAELSLPTGQIIAATSGFVGPYEVDDDVPYVVGGKSLAHYFFSFVADVKASNA